MNQTRQHDQCQASLTHRGHNLMYWLQKMGGLTSSGQASFSVHHCLYGMCGLGVQLLGTLHHSGHHLTARLLLVLLSNYKAQLRLKQGLTLHTSYSVACLQAVILHHLVHCAGGVSGCGDENVQHIWAFQQHGLETCRSCCCTPALKHSAHPQMNKGCIPRGSTRCKVVEQHAGTSPIELLTNLASNSCKGYCADSLLAKQHKLLLSNTAGC